MRCQFKWDSSFYVILQTDNSEIKFYTYTCDNLPKYMYVCLVRNTHLKTAENFEFQT
jgi:hypothetical protein